MGKLCVYLQTNKTTGASCNTDLDAKEAADLIHQCKPFEFPIYVKKEGCGNVAIMIDLTFGDTETKESLIALLHALDGQKLIRHMTEKDFI